MRERRVNTASNDLRAVKSLWDFGEDSGREFARVAGRRRGGHGVDERGLAVGPPQPCYKGMTRPRTPRVDAYARVELTRMVCHAKPYESVWPVPTEHA